MACITSADSLHRFRLILDAQFMKELSVAEQRYPAVLAVIETGWSSVCCSHALTCERYRRPERARVWRRGWA